MIFNKPWEMDNHKHGPLLLGAPAVLGAGASAAGLTAGAATAGLFGAGGAFSLGATLSTVGTAFSALSSISSAGAKSSAAEFNAAQARRDAEQTRLQTEADVERADRERRLRLGANIAKGAARGIGQPLDILRDNAAQEELNILTIKNRGGLTHRSTGRGGHT